MNFIRLILLGVIFLSSCNRSNLSHLSLIPWPNHLEKRTGSFTLSGKTVIACRNDSSLLSLADLLKEQLLLSAGLKLSAGINQNAESQILLQKSSMIDSLGKEGYILDINEKSIIISAATDTGIFHGIQTLLQLMPAGVNARGTAANAGKWRIPCLRIIDKPRFAWRSMHLDVSRHFFSKEFIKKYIDILAMHKINFFHWHLTDDQGWRIEIRKYPLLTQVGAWRISEEDKEWNYFCEISNDKTKNLYGGFYTQEDIHEIVAYAKQRFVTIVPEIEMPGHSMAAMVAYPELACTGRIFKKSPDVPFEFTDPYCAGNEKSFTFLEDILTEVMQLFPGKYIHVGGDEAKKIPWANCPKCKARMKKEGLKNLDELQSYFMKRVEAFLEAKGRRLIGWDEILEGGLAQGATVMSWRGEEGGVKAARSGHDAIMTPGEYLYFSRDQIELSKHTGNLIAYESVYNYNPVPPELTKDEARHIIGLGGCLWSEQLQNDSVAESHLLPRLCALAETGWTCPENKNLDRFTESMNVHYYRLNAIHAKFFIQPPAGLADDVFYARQCTIAMKLPVRIGTIRYTKNGDEPSVNAADYKRPIVIQNSALIRAITVLPGGLCSPVVSGKYTREALREPVNISNAVQGLQMKLYTGEITGLDSFSTLKLKETRQFDAFRLPEGCPGEFFGLEFNGFLQVPENGVYAFNLSSDDGSRLYIGNELLIDYDGVHGANWKTGKIALKKGFHSIRLIFFQNRYGKSLNLEYSGPGIRKQEVPGTALFSQQTR